MHVYGLLLAMIQIFPYAFYNYPNISKVVTNQNILFKKKKKYWSKVMKIFFNLEKMFQ